MELNKFVSFYFHCRAIKEHAKHQDTTYYDLSLNDKQDSDVKDEASVEILNLLKDENRKAKRSTNFITV